jgi:hypothetical protein
MMLSRARLSAFVEVCMKHPGLAALTAATVLTWSGVATAVELPANDYPTTARADYVFACMQTNGQDRITLEKCSCSIDAIAALLPYADYESAQTIMSIGQTPGRNTELFRDYGPYKEKVKDLKRAQVEAELRCF